MHKTFFMFFLYACFVVLETCKIKPVCLSRIALLPSFIALFSCTLLHWVVILHGWWDDIVIKQA